MTAADTPTPAATSGTANGTSVTASTAAVPTATVPAADLEAAAVAAALMVFTSGGADGGEGAPTPRWRFSGRWWAKPVPLRRDRP